MDFKIHFNIKYVHNKTYDQNLNCKTYMNGRNAANVFHERIDGCNISCTPSLSCIS